MIRITAITRPTAKGHTTQHLVVIADHECWLSWQSFLLVLTMGIAANQEPYERWSHPSTWPFTDRHSHRIWRLKKELITNGLRIWPITTQREVETIPLTVIQAYRWNVVPQIDREVEAIGNLPVEIQSKLKIQWIPNGREERPLHL